MSAAIPTTEEPKYNELKAVIEEAKLELDPKFAYDLVTVLLDNWKIPVDTQSIQELATDSTDTTSTEALLDLLEAVPEPKKSEKSRESKDEGKKDDAQLACLLNYIRQQVSTFKKTYPSDNKALVSDIYELLILLKVLMGCKEEATPVVQVPPTTQSKGGGWGFGISSLAGKASALAKAGAAMATTATKMTGFWPLETKIRKLLETINNSSEHTPQSSEFITLLKKIQLLISLMSCAQFLFPKSGKIQSVLKHSGTSIAWFHKISRILLAIINTYEKQLAPKDLPEKIEIAVSITTESVYSVSDSVAQNKIPNSPSSSTTYTHREAHLHAVEVVTTVTKRKDRSLHRFSESDDESSDGEEPKFFDLEQKSLRDQSLWHVYPPELQQNNSKQGQVETEPETASSHTGSIDNDTEPEFFDAKESSDEPSSSSSQPEQLQITSDNTESDKLNVKSEKKTEQVSKTEFINAKFNLLPPIRPYGPPSPARGEGKSATAWPWLGFGLIVGAGGGIVIAAEFSILVTASWLLTFFLLGTLGAITGIAIAAIFQALPRGKQDNENMWWLAVGSTAISSVGIALLITLSITANPAIDTLIIAGAIGIFSGFLLLAGVDFVVGRVSRGINFKWSELNQELDKNKDLSKSHMPSPQHSPAPTHLALNDAQKAGEGFSSTPSTP